MFKAWRPLCLRTFKINQVGKKKKLPRVSLKLFKSENTESLQADMHHNLQAGILGNVQVRWKLWKWKNKIPVSRGHKARQITKEKMNNQIMQKLEER